MRGERATEPCASWHCGLFWRRLFFLNPQHWSSPASPDPANMPVSKATKKFEKNKLHDVIKKRKEVAKIKQRKHLDVKKKERKARDNAKAEDLESHATQVQHSKSTGAADGGFGDMSMDHFLKAASRYQRWQGKGQRNRNQASVNARLSKREFQKAQMTIWSRQQLI